MFTISRRFTYKGHLLTCFGLGGVICHWLSMAGGFFPYEIQCSRTLDVPFFLWQYIKPHSISGVLFAPGVSFPTRFDVCGIQALYLSEYRKRRLLT